MSVLQNSVSPLRIHSFAGPATQAGPTSPQAAIGDGRSVSSVVALADDLHSVDFADFFQRAKPVVNGSGQRTQLINNPQYELQRLASVYQVDSLGPPDAFQDMVDSVHNEKLKAGVLARLS